MSTIILLRLDWFIRRKVMFIAVLRIMRMKKDCWRVLWYFSIMVELGNWKFN
ncbi:MAG TPA: hypothetical protein VKX40_06110 [Aequorivita sp.]|nr:hypothetical protein [Aequorivita sp.]